MPGSLTPPPDEPPSLFRRQTPQTQAVIVGAVVVIVAGILATLGAIQRNSGDSDPSERPTAADNSAPSDRATDLYLQVLDAFAPTIAGGATDDELVNFGTWVCDELETGTGMDTLFARQANLGNSPIEEVAITLDTAYTEFCPHLTIERDAPRAVRQPMTRRPALTV